MNRIALLLLLFAVSALSQMPEFTNEDTLTIVWHPSTSSDVKYYKAYFNTENETITREINQWSIEDDSCSYVYDVPLYAGDWMLYMTAIDSSDLESDKSNLFYFKITDSKPQPPYHVRIIIK